MTVWIPFEQIHSHTPIRQVGGKAWSLAELQRQGHCVPQGGCIPAPVYRAAINASALRENLELELHRKSVAEMRWEELWDAALRIRNRFLKLALPQPVEEELRAALVAEFGQRPVAVRSSALDEDSAATSFAGLHESVVGVAGPAAILQSVRQVWASLWSDRALLYRQELGLRVDDSAMAVVVQELAEGSAAGVAFSQNPMDSNQGVVEGIAGRGEEFVDGCREPDRWFFSRADHSLETCALANGAAAPCLTPSQAQQTFATAYELETRFGQPQDMEWTWVDDNLVLLQVRAITTPPPVEPHGHDKRGWYLTLTRSLPELQTLHRKITESLLPEMEREASAFAAETLADLSDADLVMAFQQRQAAAAKWQSAYWESCIPFAHGMRLFGQIYNDRLQPADPHEFMTLLRGSELISIRRNETLRKLGQRLRALPDGGAGLFQEESKVDSPCAAALDTWLEEFGSSLPPGEEPRRTAVRLARSLAEAAGHDERRGDSPVPLRKQWLQAFAEDERPYAVELLELGRASYALRDNDNHYLERVEEEVARAQRELAARLAKGSTFPSTVIPFCKVSDDEVIVGPEQALPALMERIRGKQLTGQPSSAGLAVGPARVIHREEELLHVERGEVLVCDAISPTMTVVIPLVAAIVERRGGMLIHGAIIAREYGIPCVTGVANATALIATGQTLSVDGHLGLVTVRM